MFETEIRQVLFDQQKDIALLRDDCVARDVAPLFFERLKSSLIKVVMGVRRCGKSTLCLQTGKDEHLAYVNFDDERLTALTTKDLNLVYEILLQLKPNAKYFIFDEIQNIEHWELFVNRLKRKGLNLIVTGSNGKLLSHDLASHLTGRQLALELMPFSFGEFLKIKGASIPQSNDFSTEERATLLRFFGEYFKHGGFPEVARGEAAGPYLRELFDKIISRDIAQRHDLRTPRILKELALSLIQQSGSLTSLQRLLKTFNYRSVNTLRKHISYLQDAYLLYEVEAYSNKTRERSTAARKNYACDVGLMETLNTKPTPDYGMRLETLVYLHCRRQAEVYYLRSPDYDVDFAIVENRKIKKLIQVCYDLSREETREREIGSLIAAAKAWNVADLQIVTWSESEIIRQGGLNIMVTPGWRFCLQSTQAPSLARS